MHNFPAETITPSLHELVKLQAKVREIQHYKRKASPASLSGNLITKFKGQGLEFSQVRKYYRGDDIRSIDWRVTARTGTTHIKEFQIEKESEIAIISNVGPEMQFATFGKFKYILACELISLLCFAAEYNKEKISTYFFGTNLKQIKAFKQKNRKNITLEILQFLTKTQPLKTQNLGNDLLGCLKEFNLVNKASGIAFIICDFNEINNSIINEIQYIKRKKNIYLCHIFDNCEEYLPNIGSLSFCSFDGANYDIDSSDKAASKSYVEFFKKKTELLKELSKDPKINLINLPTNADPLKQLVNAF